MIKTCYLDFEFNRVTEPKLNLVSCATFDEYRNEKIKWWVHSDPYNNKKLYDYLKKFDLIIGFSCVAEARSFLSLGLNPLKFKWIDLFIEYRCITNHNDELQWGEQLVDGVVKTVRKPRPRWEREEGEVANSFKATHSLAEATFKLTGKIRDTKEKNEMRDLIISDPEEFTEIQKERILHYNMSDTVHLAEIWRAIKEQYFKLDPTLTEETLNEEAELRGRFIAHTAIMEHKGYPIDVEKTRNFSSQVGNIMYDCQKEINNLFPDIRPFRWNRKDNKFSWDQKATREWVIKFHSDKDWMKTDGGDISLSLEAFQRYFDFKHDYPLDNFGAQMVRFLKLKQNLYGFVQSPGKKKKTFWDNVGSDGRVRPYLNPFGAQSSRSQPSSTGFMFLKPAWMRALVSPAPGMAMAGIDYGSQEFFISALRSRDKKMIEAYLSGDVYLSFLKESGIVPPDATKKSHALERDTIGKPVILGISYLMTKYGLAINLSQKSGRVWTEYEAQKLIDMFDSIYPDFAEYREWILECYKEDRFIKLPDGWYMWGDNENHRSVTNVPIQGFGAAVMRKAVDLAHSRGLYIPFPLHDALYTEFKIGDEHVIPILRDCMQEAFVHFFPDDLKDIASKIKLDPKAWSMEYPDKGELDIEGYKVPCSSLHIDSRSLNDYNAFSKYFDTNIGSLL